MASGAESVVCPLDVGTVNAVTAGAGDAVPGVGGLKAVRLTLIGGVAAEARAVDGIRLAAGEDFEFGGIEGFDMSEAGTVAGFAGAAFMRFVRERGGLRGVADDAAV